MTNIWLFCFHAYITWFHVLNKPFKCNGTPQFCCPNNYNCTVESKPDLIWEKTNNRSNTKFHRWVVPFLTTWVLYDAYLMKNRSRTFSNSTGESKQETQVLALRLRIQTRLQKTQKPTGHTNEGKATWTRLRNTTWTETQWHLRQPTLQVLPKNLQNRPSAQLQCCKKVLDLHKY